jgi:hypothetical protein
MHLYYPLRYPIMSRGPAILETTTTAYDGVQLQIWTCTTRTMNPAQLWAALA